MLGAGSFEADELRLLSGLWLREPDAEMARLATNRLGLPSAEPAKLAAAYADLFLLNVYPYGTVFTEPDAELNGPGAQRLAALYAAQGFQPHELSQVAAPDHLGVCLGFWAHLADRQMDSQSFVSELLGWAPVCCLAVEREPAAHPFYRSLARLTRERLLAEAIETSGAAPLDETDGWALSTSPDEEVRLRDVLRFFLAPARCGLFLSRGHLGQIGLRLGLRLPFGSRYEVAEALFQAAGETAQVESLVVALEAEIEVWRSEVARWAVDQPGWQAVASAWLARTASAADRLIAMRHDLARPNKVGTERP